MKSSKIKIATACLTTVLGAVVQFSGTTPAQAQSAGEDSARCRARSSHQERILRGCLDDCSRDPRTTTGSPTSSELCRQACQRSEDDALRELRARYGCSVDAFEPFLPTSTRQSTTRLIATETGPAHREVTVVDDQMIFEGDIAVKDIGPSSTSSSDVATTMGAGRTDVDARWPDMIIPYWIDPALPWPERVTDAVQQWEASSRIRFRALREDEKNSGLFDFVEFTPGTGCTSPVGRQGGSQQLRLDYGCATPNVVHELGHAIGLWHEQSRVDRDKHIVIHWDNLRPGVEYNFSTYQEMAEDGVDLGPFDFDSIMIYPSLIRDPSYVYDTERPTITRLDGSAWNRANRLSAGDIAAAHLIYESPVWISAVGAGAGNGRQGAAARTAGHDVFCLPHQTCLAGDVDGDGREDLTAVDLGKPQRAWVVLSDGSELVPNPGALAWSERVTARARRFRLGDVDGDGMSDLVALRGGRLRPNAASGVTKPNAPGSVTVALSDGQQFQPGTRWHTALCANEWDCRLGDVDGDGKADLVQFPKRRTVQGVWVAKSTGKSFADPVLWHADVCTAGQICRLGDVDADGRADVVAFDVASGQARVARSTGTAFVVDAAYAANLSGADVIDVADVDGNHRADVVGFSSAGSPARTALASGNGFTVTDGYVPVDACQAGEACFLADLAGDGRSEVVAYQR
jgi:hypothetical protein